MPVQGAGYVPEVIGPETCAAGLFQSASPFGGAISHRDSHQTSPTNRHDEAPVGDRPPEMPAHICLTLGTRARQTQPIITDVVFIPAGWFHAAFNRWPSAAMSATSTFRATSTSIPKNRDAAKPARPRPRWNARFAHTYDFVRAFCTHTL